ASRFGSSGAGHTDAVRAVRSEDALETTATYPDLSESCPSAGRSLTFWNSSSVSCTLAPSAKNVAAANLWRTPTMASPSLRDPAFFRALEARGLALQLAQVEEAGALRLAAGDHLDLVDARRIEREDALHAHAVAHLAHGERGVHVPALAADDDSLEDLDSLLVAFADLRMHAQGVTDAEFRHLAADFRRDVALLHQLDRLRTHLRTSLITARPKTICRQAFCRVSRSGRRSRVRATACSRRHSAILPWSPESSTSGTFNPRKSGGRVY